jgi:2-polyprenyl-3-methyl-5-hydroxy-6-metoxy-1,4-benzoquinol methylase
VVEDGRTGWVFRPDREDEMASALDRALGAPIEALDTMREHCLERAEAFTAESASRGMLAAIDYAARGERRAGCRTATAARIAATRPHLACPLCGHASARGATLRHAEVRRCPAPDCGLRFADPQPDDAALREAYRTLYYPSRAATAQARAAIVDWDETPPGTLRELMEAIGARTRAVDAPRLLDYGCGRGALGRAAREAGLAVVGIEPDAEARCAAERDAGLRAYADVAALRRELSDARFDVITLWQVIEHLRRPWDDLVTLREMLSPDGMLVVATPNARCLRARIEGARWENVANPTHLHYFTERSLRRVLSASGFETVERLAIPAAYPHHGPLRRTAQRVLRACDLEGDVVLIARVADV